MSSATQNHNRTGTRRLLELARHETLFLSLGTLALLIASGTGLAAPALVGHLVDGITEGAGRDALDRAALFLLGLFAVSGVSSALRSYLFTVAGERLVARLRSNLYQAVLAEIGFFDARQTKLINRWPPHHRPSECRHGQYFHGVALRRSGAGAIGILLWIGPRLCSSCLPWFPSLRHRWLLRKQTPQGEPKGTRRARGRIRSGRRDPRDVRALHKKNAI